MAVATKRAACVTFLEDRNKNRENIVTLIRELLGTQIRKVYC